MTNEGWLGTASAAFLAHCRVEKGLSANTLASYSFDLKDFQRFREDRKAAGGPPSAEDLNSYVDHLTSAGLAASSIARRRFGYTSA